MSKTFAKRPPRSDARQHCDPFIRLPPEWEAVKQAMLARSQKDTVPITLTEAG